MMMSLGPSPITTVVIADSDFYRDHPRGPAWPTALGMEVCQSVYVSIPIMCTIIASEPFDI